MKSWKKTQIWQQLDEIKNDEAEAVRTFLSLPECMAKIETTLNKGGTSPKDFTLHDADHSFRVAERMWEIVPNRTKLILSEYELAMLLLSAYLHDVGMTPEHQKVNNHFLMLKSSDKSSLTEPEKENFQKWLDVNGEQINIEKDIVSDDARVTEIVTYYCRHMHNDWSEKWILNNLNGQQLGRYTNWINDLIRICKSHHYGLEELKREEYNPLRIHSRVVHLRYLAMCLRLADVIEIDPERAPSVLIKHRNVIDSSLSHWLKEKFTSIDIKNNAISVTARPEKAFIHKAIEDVADQIEHETNLCNILQVERPLSNIFPTNDLEHKWDILPSVFRDIKETGKYEYIDGTFRPNAKKLLQLFAGTELYGNPILAIRELIQNSLDAVKVQIGYKLLEDGTVNPEQVNALSQKLSVELSIVNEKEEYWICCKDNGCGMDRDIIKKCFLVGGAVKRYELLELERKCASIGHRLELTGQFGIGVLSYFMIADKILIQTKRSTDSGGHNAQGLEFEINGFSDFGELRNVEIDGNGSIVKLRVKKELAEIVTAAKNVIELLEDCLVRIPCNFTFTSLNKEILSYEPGWCWKEQHFKDDLIKQLDFQTEHKINTSTEFISEEVSSIIETSQKRKSEIQKDYIDSIAFISDEGTLNNNNGYYRIHIPIFKNKKGKSFAYFFEHIQNGALFLNKIHNGFLFYPYNSLRVSWKGIGIESEEHYREFPFSISWKGIGTESKEHYRKFPFSNCYVELDLVNEVSFQISISRLRVNYKSSLSFLLLEVRERISELINKKGKALTKNTYALFNQTVAPLLNVASKDHHWTFDKGYGKTEHIKFEKLRFPIIFDVSHEIGEKHEIEYLNHEVHRLENLRICGAGYKSFEINKYDYKFDRAVYNEYYNFRISFLKTKSLEGANKFAFLGNSAEFPPNWNNLFCFRGYHESDIILNVTSPYFKFVKKDDYEYVKSLFKEKISLNTDEGKAILKSKSKCFAFMLNLIALNEKTYWSAVTKRNPKFIEALWKKMFKKPDEKLCFFFGGIALTYITIISQQKWEELSDTKEILKHLPMPSDDWKIKKRQEKASG